MSATSPADDSVAKPGRTPLIPDPALSEPALSEPRLSETVLNEARKRVLACSRSLVDRGLVVGSSGNVSERIDAEHFVVTPAGIVYDELELTAIPIVNVQTGQWSNGLRPTSEIALHLGLYRANATLGAIVHTHSRHAAAFAVAGVDLPFIVNENISTQSECVLVTEYAPPGSVDLGEQALRTFARQPGSQAVLLANHGVVALGPTLAKAELVAAQVEWVAEIAYLSSTLRRDLGATRTLPIAMQDAIGRNYGVTFSRETAATSSTSPTSQDSVGALIDVLGLEPLPSEGGLFRQVWQSSQRDVNGRPLGTSILAAFTGDPDSFSAMHRLASTEIWHASAGDPIQMLLLHPDGSVSEPVLGNDVGAGQQLQVVVPAGTWMGASLAGEKASFGVFGCTMAPGFVESDYEGAAAAALCAQWPQAAARITQLTRNGGPLTIDHPLKTAEEGAPGT